MAERYQLDSITEAMGKAGSTLITTTDVTNGNYSVILIASTNVVIASITSGTMTNSSNIASLTGLAIGFRYPVEYTSITLTSGNVIAIHKEGK